MSGWDEVTRWQQIAEERTAQLHEAHAEIIGLKGDLGNMSSSRNEWRRQCLAADLEVARLKAVPIHLLAAAYPGRDYWAKGYREALRAVRREMAGE